MARLWARADQLSVQTGEDGEDEDEGETLYLAEKASKTFYLTKNLDSTSMIEHGLEHVPHPPLALQIGCCCSTSY